MVSGVIDVAQGKTVKYLFTILVGLAISISLLSCNPAQYDLRTTTNPNEGGTITPNNGAFAEGTEVTFTAQPAPGYRFDHWGGDVAGTSNPLNVVMDDAKDIIAYFKAQYALDISINPGNGGMVTPSEGIYDVGTEIELMAQPTPGYNFDHWSGDATGTADNITILMNYNKIITANFKAAYRLETSVNPENAGTVTPGSGMYDVGKELSLTAKPASGYRFDHWSGDVTGTSNTFSITMNGNKNITANFVFQYALTVQISPENGGKVKPGSGNYDAGGDLSLIATPAPGYRFDHWSGDVPSDEDSVTLRLHIDEDKKVVANFVPKYTPQEIDQLIVQLSSPEEYYRHQAVYELSRLGEFISEEQINALLIIMRTGEQSWLTKKEKAEESWGSGPGDCWWYFYTSIRYYAAEVLSEIDSSYVSSDIKKEAREAGYDAIRKELVADPGHD
jgi:hypothetical protein